MVTGIEPTTSSLLDQRRSRSDNQAPWAIILLLAQIGFRGHPGARNSCAF